MNNMDVNNIYSATPQYFPTTSLQASSIKNVRRGHSDQVDVHAKGKLVTYMIYIKIVFRNCSIVF